MKLVTFFTSLIGQAQTACSNCYSRAGARGLQTFLSEGRINYYTTIQGLDISSW